MIDNMKKYLLERGLCPRSDFAKVVGIETPEMLDFLLLKDQAYIQYKEKQVANNARDSRHRENAKSSRSDEPLTSHRGEKRNGKTNP